MRWMMAESWWKVVNRRTALPIALASWALTALGDYLTGAEVAFTLLYLVPIGIAVWWRGLRFGLLLCGLSIASSIGTGLATNPLANTITVVMTLAWNVVGEFGVFLVVAFVLERLRRRLDFEVKERESAVVQLRHADRLNTLGKLASGLAHELGTPLNVVSGRAFLIASKRLMGDDACRSAEVIVKQAERMADIIKNLLVFARRGGSRKLATDLGRLVRETRSLVEPLTRTAGVDIVLDDGPPQIVPVNAGELQQVLTNLFMNAAQAMPAGGVVQVTLEHGPARLPEQRGFAPGEFAQIRVRDHGTGIAPDVLPHIFEPFFTTKEVGAGTGLGLSVSFGIVRDHGGWIEVNSKLGEGTEFVVHLPQTDDDHAPGT